MPAVGQGHIPPLHLSILNYSSCCLLVPPRTPRAHQYSRTQDVIWAVGPCSGGRWSLLPGGSLWCPRTAYLHLVFIQFSFRRKSSQPSSPNLISLPSQTRYRLRAHSQAAERWQDGLGLQRFCSLPPREALLSPAPVRTSCCSPAVSVSQAGSELPPRPPLDSGGDSGSVTIPCMAQHSFNPKNISLG